MNLDSATIKILLRIWAVALFINTLLGTAMITDFYTYAEMIGPVAFLGLFYAAVFTLPFVSLLLIILRMYLEMQLTSRRLFSYFFATGLFVTMACFTIFFLMIGTTGFPILALLLIAIGSAAIAMLMEYKSITELRSKRERIKGLSY